MEATANYHFLMQNDSIRQSDTALQAFCDALAGSSIEKFFLADQKLRNNEFNEAKTIAESVNTTNNVEATCRQFYNLNYKARTNNFNAADSTHLFALSNLCPGLDGESVYYARSLYNLIYADVYKFNENCDPGSGERVTEVQKKGMQNFELKIFPNPAAII